MFACYDCSGPSLPPPPKRDAAPGGGESKAAAATDSKPAAEERRTRAGESKPPPSSDATNGGGAAASRHKDVDMKDAPATDGSRGAGSKAAAKGAGDGGGEQDEVTRLHVGRLTRNVKEEHVREIFSTFGKLKVSRAFHPLHRCRNTALRQHPRLT